MRYHFVAFIFAVLAGVQFGLSIPLAAVCLIAAVIISIFLKKYLVSVFFCIGLMLGIVSGQAIHDNFTDLPEKGFVSRALTVTDFPELRPDGQYSVHSYHIKIISVNAFQLYKSQTVEARGYLSTFHFGGRTFANLYASEITVKNKGIPVFEAVSSLRKLVNDKILSVPDPSVRALLFTMIMGNTSFVDFGVSETFKMTGVTHLLAISGLNVLIIYGAVLWVLRKFLRKPAAGLAALGVIILYVVIAGFGASILRAGLMILVYQILDLSGRKGGFADMVLFTAGLSLLFNPLFVESAGFWLSYTAVIGIVFFSGNRGILPEKPKSPVHAAAGNVRETVKTTLSANAATLPILLYYFQGISLISPLANIIIIPAFNLITILTFIYFIFLMFSIRFILPLLDPVISLVWKFCAGTAEALSFIPFGYQTVPFFPGWALAACYFLLIGAFYGLPRLRFLMFYRKLSRMEK
jgi:ComEC/Rec2-related protein